MYLQFYRLCTIILLVHCVLTSNCLNLYAGNDFGARMTYTEVKKQGFIFVKRTKILSYTYPMGTIISGVACIDLTPNKTSTANIINGGLGQNYIEIQLESARGLGLKYIVEIYTNRINLNNK